MKTISNEELKEILEQHKLWLDSDQEEGKRANLEYINLREVNLEYVNLKEANLEKTNLRNALLWEANLKGANLKNTNLWKTDLRKTNLRDSCLVDAYLVDACLVDARLIKADLTRANLENVDLECANLSEANLTGADLTEAYIINADLNGADLTNVKNLDTVIVNERTKLEDIIIDDENRKILNKLKEKIKKNNPWLDSEEKGEAKYRVKDEDLKRTIFEMVEIIKAKLLEKEQIKGDSKIKSKELNKILENHRLWIETKTEEGERANFSGENLSYANFRYANLSGADFTETKFIKEDLIK